MQESKQEVTKISLVMILLGWVGRETSTQRTRVVYKTWTGALANSADPDRTPQNTMSDQGMHYLLKLQEVKGETKVLKPCPGPFSQPTLRDSAVSALILPYSLVNLNIIRRHCKIFFLWKLGLAFQIASSRDKFEWNTKAYFLINI